jgi:hypothetical protein
VDEDIRPGGAGILSQPKADEGSGVVDVLYMYWAMEYSRTKICFHLSPNTVSQQYRNGKMGVDKWGRGKEWRLKWQGGIAGGGGGSGTQWDENGAEQKWLTVKKRRELPACAWQIT